MQGGSNQKRLVNEFKVCSQLEGMKVSQVDNNNLQWRVVLEGTKGTPYEGGFFHVLVTFPTEYPFKFPDFKFETTMFHPNIDDKGEICRDMIGEKEWVPTKKIQSVLQVLVSLFSDVNDNALNQKAFDLYNNDKKAYDAQVKEYTKKYAQKQ